MRETQTDFETGGEGVDGASTERRPDAVSSDYLTRFAPGPSAIGSSDDLFDRGWRIRADHDAGAVYLARGDATGGQWQAETEYMEFSPANPLVQIALAFDGTARPHIAAEREDGDIWLTYPGFAFQSVVTGRTPVLATFVDPDSEEAEVLLFYIRADELRWRTSLDGYTEEHDTGEAMGANRHLESHTIDAEGRLHLAYSIRNPGSGTWTLDWLTGKSELEPVIEGACIGASDQDESIVFGDEIVLVFTADGWVEVPGSCETQDADVLLIGAGADGGEVATQDQADPTILWVDANGDALDHETALPVYRAAGGGRGGLGAGNGRGGGSGGGGGAQSPATGTSGGSAGGNGSQGFGGGSGWMSQGFLPTRRAASGGGGGPLGPGAPGEFLVTPPRGGIGGSGGPVSSRWPTVSIAPGGNGNGVIAFDGGSTGDVGGGGGSGGFLEQVALTLRSGARIKVQVGRNTGSGLGGGGRWDGKGGSGLALIRARFRPLPPSPAVLSGGDQTIEAGGYRYHIFRTPGVLTCTTAGYAEAVAIGGGAGGGSGVGGGAGAGAVMLAGPFGMALGDFDVEPGPGGLGGVNGQAGQFGGASTLEGLLEAPGGAPGSGVTQGGPGRNGASGGGGHGDADAVVEGGTGQFLRGMDGGDGRGYTDLSDAPVGYAGGGGGTLEEGKEGATQQFMGSPLSESWTPNGTAWGVDVVKERLLFNGGASISHNDISRGEMLVQATILPRVSIPPSGSNFVHLMARLSPGDNLGYGIGFSRGSVASNLSARIYSRTSTGGLSSSIGTIDSGPVAVQDYDVELYVADGVQEGWINGLGTASATNTDHDGQNARSAGFYRDSSQITEADHFRAYPTKYVTVTGLSAGETVRVLDEDGLVVGTPGAESGGIGRTSISNYDAGRKLPAAGYRSVQVMDGIDVVAEYSGGGVIPGAQMTRDGAVITVDLDGDGELPLTGLLAYDDFDGQTPGPELGDGGDGIDLSAWLNGTVTGDGGWFGGGGGGGSESVVAGKGGRGGGGDGTRATGTPGAAGLDDTGGGGGGSRETTEDGGKGGDGIVVVRTEIVP